MVFSGFTDGTAAPLLPVSLDLPVRLSRERGPIQWLFASGLLHLTRARAQVGLHLSLGHVLLHGVDGPRGVYPLSCPQTPCCFHIGATVNSICCSCARGHPRTWTLQATCPCAHVFASLLGGHEMTDPGCRSPWLLPCRALTPAKSRKQAPHPPRGVGSSPPAKGPRLRPRVWEAPLPGPSLSSLPGEHTQAFQSALRKYRSLMAHRNIIVFLLLITFRVNYIATRFVLYDIAAKSACARLGLEQVSHPCTLRLSHLDQCLILSI